VVTKKNGSEMAFATLEDETGKIELVVFPKTYSSYRELWVKDRVVIVEGKIETRDERVTVVADKAEALNPNAEVKYDFVVRVPNGTSSKVLMNLNQLLKKRSGDKMGILIFENGNGEKKKLELNFGVDFNAALASEIDSLLKT